MGRLYSWPIMGEERFLAERVTAVITGTGRFLPDNEITNAELFNECQPVRDAFDVDKARAAIKRVDLSADTDPAAVFDHWVRQVTGVETRRHLSPESGLTTEDMCADACRAALDAAGREATDMDMILVGSLTAADEVPNAACTVAERLGAPGLGGYVLNAACAGFVYGIGAAWSAIVSGMAERILVVSGDTLTRYINYSDLRTAAIFGDGAGAVVLERGSGDRGVLGPPSYGGEFDRGPLFMVGQGWELPDEPFPVLHMEGGPRILRAAITKMSSIATEALRRAGVDWSDVDIVIPHQANLRITQGLERALRLKRGRVIHNIMRYGNMSASTVAVTLDEVVRGMHGEVPDSATIVLTSVGGGYTTAAAVVRL